MVQSAEGAADFLFFSGQPPVAQFHDSLQEFALEDRAAGFTQDDVEQMADLIIDGNKRLLDDFINRGSCDCSYGLGGVARFRVNIFKRQGRHAIVMRRLPADIPSIDSLGLPHIFRKIVLEKNGIILLTGATGSGKTTTLAALLNELNQTQELHILTLEDPIEYIHPSQRSIFSQRELGKDFSSFAEGLRAALRQAPKVILVGEIRDRESMEIALSASETGHLVFATLHTIGAGQTIHRIVGMFASEEEQQVRQRLADTMRYIVSQRLVNKVDGGRLLVTEIMGSSLRTREALLYGEAENRMFSEIIEAATIHGWHTFDQELLKALDEHIISEDCAMIFASSKNKMRRDIEHLKQVRSPKEVLAAASGLKLQNTGKPMEQVAREPRSLARRIEPRVPAEPKSA